MDTTKKSTVTFRHMEHSPVIEDYVLKELIELDKFLHQERSPIACDMVIEARPVHSRFIAELVIRTPNFYEVAKDEGFNINEVIDSVIKKMSAQLGRKKARRIDERKEVKVNNKP